MLVAQTSSNELFTLTNEVTKDELHYLRETTTFYCPQCKDPLQLKVGHVKIPHFAHIRKVVCGETFSERESAQHLLGKQHLLEFFSQFTKNVQLESIIPSLQQRPDLLVHLKGKQYAVEFQCSRIDPNVFMARTNGYVSRHITPIWLLKAPANYYTNQTMKITLNEFQRLFVRKYQERQYLLMYDPISKKFLYYNHLLHLYKNSYIATIQLIPQEHQVFPFFVPNCMDEEQFQLHLKVYAIYRQKFISQRIKYSRKGVQDLFLRSLYELRMNRDQLPSFIGIPTKYAQYVPLFSIEWQTLLFYFLHLQQLNIDQVDQRTIHYFLIWSNLPKTEQVSKAIFHYIELLRTLYVKHLYSVIDNNFLFELLYREVVAIS